MIDITHRSKQTHLIVIMALFNIYCGAGAGDGVLTFMLKTVCVYPILIALCPCHARWHCTLTPFHSEYLLGAICDVKHV